jgi:hypothetical protein
MQAASAFAVADRLGGVRASGVMTQGNTLEASMSSSEDETYQRFKRWVQSPGPEEGIAGGM